MTQEEKIKDLEQRIALMDDTNSALCADLEHWKKVAAGLKGYNKKLLEQAQHYKELDLEGDELYEKTICENLELKRQLEVKDKIINGLESQVGELSVQKSELEYAKKAMDDSIAEYEITVAKLRRPWWKKLFS
jgi:chromosome segregation ATPase